MANNKLHGYTPSREEEKKGNGLETFHPHEFRTGMDYELVAMGCSTLSESTVDEREKATVKVLKNLKEYSGYYSSLISYETHFRNEVEGSKKPSFKTWLEEQNSHKMQEVKRGDKDSKHKTDKMTELKEAIKREISNILEVKGKEAEKINKADAKKEKEEKTAPISTAKGKAKKLANLEKEASKLDAERTKLKDSQKGPLSKYRDGKMSSSEYTIATKESVKRIKEIITRLKEIENEKEEITLAEKMGRREVAKTMMEKDTHMAILEIIKEAGVNLREGADGIKMYYEIAKTAYQEGFMAGVNKN